MNLGEKFAEALQSSGGNEGLALRRISEPLAEALRLLQDAASDPNDVYMALMDLCEFLPLISNEESFALFNVGEFVSAWVQLLGSGATPEIMVLAARALVHTMEACPATCGTVASSGGAEALVLGITCGSDYENLSEQCLHALHKLSAEHGPQVLAAGGLGACLMHIEFLMTPSQRVAAAAAANLCSAATDATFSQVLSAIDSLAALLVSHDVKVIESGALAFGRLAEAFSGRSEERLAQALRPDVLRRLVQIASAPPAGAPASLRAAAFHSLAAAAAGSQAIVRALLEDAGTTAALMGALGSQLPPHSHSQSQTQPQQSPHQRSLTSSSPSASHQPPPPEVLELIGELLPKMSPAMAKAFSASSVARMLFREVAARTRRRVSASADGQAEAAPPAEATDQQQAFAQAVLPALLGVFTQFSGLSATARHRCLSAISRAVTSLPRRPARVQLLREVGFAGFVARLLGNDDPALLVIGLRMCEALLDGAPTELVDDFQRHGVFSELRRLARESQTPHEADSLEGAVTNLAKDVLSKHQPRGSESSVSERATRLRAVCSALSSPTTAVGALQALREEIKTTSAFELVEGGVVDALLAFLTPSDSRAAALRARTFLSAITSAGGADTSAFESLVALAQDALCSVERLQLTTAQDSSLRLLSLPFRLRIRRADGETGLKDFQSQTSVSIDPLATTESIEQFLWSRVQLDEHSGSTTAGSEGRGSRRQKSPAPDEQEDEEEMEAEGEEEVDEDAEKIADRDEGGAHDDDTSVDLAGSPSPALASRGRTTPHTSPAPRRSPAAMVVRQPPRKLVLCINGMPLERQTSFFEAVQRLSPTNDLASARQLWETIYEVTYKLPTQSSAPGGATIDGAMDVDSHDALRIIPLEDEPIGYALSHIPLDAFLKEFDQQCGRVLALLSALHILSQEGRMTMGWIGESRPVIPPAAFISTRLTQKLFRQLSDPLSICACALPRWVRFVSEWCPWIVQYDMRDLLFLASTFGPARALLALQSRLRVGIIPGKERDQTMRIPRQKVRISRNKVLESAIKVMDIGAFKSILEIEYFGESGSGLGPTLEFYTLVSREACLASHGLWYTDNRDATADGHVVAPNGLYPRPAKEISRAQQELFKFLGTFCAKAMMDQRLIDLPFSDAFLKWMLGKSLGVEDVASLSPTIGRSLLKLAEVARSKAYGCSTPSKLTVGGCPVEDLALDFTFPGDPSWELLPNGSKIAVTLDNVGRYVSVVTDSFLRGSGALAAFKTGFEAVFPMRALHAFASPEELRVAMCGDGGDDDSVWSKEALYNSIKCEHGYTVESAQVQDLVSVMSEEFSHEDRRNFVLFLTGSPRLPVGGFAALNPKFTVVRRADEPAEIADQNLPSVNCCFYYLKLPNYSSRQVLKQRMLYAIYNGQGSFLLT